MPYQNQYLARVPSLTLRIIDHWKEHAPEMYRELVEAGELRSEAQLSAEQTWGLAERLEKGGLDPLQAQSQAMRQVALHLSSHRSDE